MFKIIWSFLIAALMLTSIPVSAIETKSGPCAVVPVLMYHHIQDIKVALKNKQTSLTVTPEDFRKNLEYLKKNNFSTISMAELIAFFDSGGSLPKKPVMLTFDDAYEDNYVVMLPILKEYGFKATIFTPTGLVQNPGYLSWERIKEMSGSGLVTFGNHTWSHHSSNGTAEVLRKEITLADTQLKEHDQNQVKVYAYPYGKPSRGAIQALVDLNYKIAFTTNSGKVLCKGKRFELPRLRVGGRNLRI